MPEFRFRESQKIKAYGSIEVIDQPQGRMAIQKGYIGGRTVQIEIPIANMQSKRRINNQMQKAIKQGNFLALGLKKSEDDLAFLEINRENILKKASDTKNTIESVPVRSWNSQSRIPRHKISPMTLKFMGTYFEPPLLSASKIRSKKTWNLFSFFPFNQLNKEYLSVKTKARIAVSAEHMAKGAHSQSTRKLIQKAMNSEKVDIQLHKKAPSNFLEAYKSYVFNKKNLPRYLFLNRQIKRLAPGECHIFTIPIYRHAMVGMVVKQQNGCFTYYHCNSGHGLLSHPMKSNLHSTKYLFQPYIVKDIPQKKLTKFISSYAKKRFLAENVYIYLPNKFSERFGERILKWIYQQLPDLGKRRVKHDQRFWQSSQIGGSCAGGAEKVLLKMTLTDKSFHDLFVSLKIKDIFKLYKDYPKSLDKNYLKHVILDMITDLKFEQLSQEMVDSLAAIKETLEQKPNRPKKLQLSSKLKKKIFREYAKIDPMSQNHEELLKKICYFIATNNYQAAHQMISDLYTQRHKFTIEDASVIYDILEIFKNEEEHDYSLMNLYYGLYKTLDDGLYKILNGKFTNPFKSENYYQAEIYKIYPDSPWAWKQL